MTQNILRADIGNHSLILLQTTEYYKRELVTPGLQKDINRAIIYVPGSSHTYMQQNQQYIKAHIT